VLVEAETPDGEVHSLLLQNAETVRLIGPSAHQSGGRKAGADIQLTNEDFDRARQKHGEQAEWRAISVSELKPGQQVYVLRQAAARHTGISIDEFIREQ
jgi:3-dehydroquinate synthase class II